ncbi:MAG TPA: GNAT family N-acetyltransferase [Actinomycetota bacterium]|nr:GNAT family N-acetyltransferase [Actinomycetota bacterium]
MAGDEVTTETPPAVVRIREADEADARAIAEVHVRSWRWAYRGQLPDDTLDTLDVAEREGRWRAAIADPATSVLVAGDDDVLDGFVSVGPARDDAASPSTAEVHAIYLEEHAAGKGIGRALLEQAVEAMRAAGAQRASLWVLESNARARRFYERAGWAWDGTRSSHQVQCSNMPIVRYVREL